MQKRRSSLILPNRRFPRHALFPSTRATGWLAVALLGIGATCGQAQTVSTWNGGTGNWSTAGLWTPTGTPNTANADVRLDGGKTGTTSLVNVDGSYTVGRLTIDAGDSLNINNGQSLTISAAGGFAGAGTLVNNGSLTLAGTSAYTDLLISGNVTLAGTGTLNLQNADRVRGSGTLTNASTIQGATVGNTTGGSLGNGEINIVNAVGGLINANVSADTLIVTPATAGGLTNAGTMQASNGGVLQLRGGGTFTNTGAGVIQALNGSQVQLTSGANVSGGILTTAGSGSIRNVGTATLGSLTNNGTFIANSGTTTTLAAGSTLTNNGSLTLANTSGYTDLVLAGNVTLSGSGTLNLQNADRVRGSGTLTNASTIQGDTLGNSTGGSLGNGEINITNQGLIHANTGSRLNIAPASSFANSGTLRASNGSLALVSGPDGSVTNLGAFVASGNNSTVRVPAAALANYGGGTLVFGSYIASGTNAATPATVDIAGATVTTNVAGIKLIGSGAAIPAINAMNVNNGGYFALDGNRTFTTVGNLSNQAGTLAVAAGSTLTVNGALTQTDGYIVGAGTVIATSHTLSSTVAPGALVLTESPNLDFDPSLHTVGTLTLQGTVAFTNTATIQLSLGTAAGPGIVGADNDHLSVRGAFTLDGTLNVTARAGFGPGTYDILDYSGGTFTNNGLDLGTLPAGYNYQIVTTIPGQVDLIVSVVPEPSTWALLSLGGVGVLGLAARRCRRVRSA